MIYVFAIAVAMLFGFLADKKVKVRTRIAKSEKVIKKIFMVLSFSILAFIPAVRYEVGTDFFSYYRLYSNIDTGYGETLEPGYRIFVRILNILSDNPQIFFVFSSMLIVGCWYWMIYSQSSDYMYSILLFALTNDYFRSMNGVRQYMAIAIVILALPSIKKGNWKRTLIYLIIACCFHTSAIVFSVLYILYKISIRPTISIISVSIVFLFGNQIKKIIFPIIDKYTGYGRYFLGNSNYAESETAVISFMIYLSFFLLLTYEFRKVKQNDNLKLLYSASLLGMIIAAMSTVMPTNVTRLMYYVNPIIALYVPEATGMLGDKKIRFLVNAAIIICYAVVTISLLLRGNQDVLPYKAFWNV